MYVTLEEVKSYDLPALAAKSDGQLHWLIELYGGVIDGYCRTRFTPTDAYYHADTYSPIRLPKGPLLQVDSVTYQNTLLTEGRDYFVYPEKNVLELANGEGFQQKKRSLVIRYWYGYQEVPAIVKKVLLDLLKLDVQAGEHDMLAAQESWDGEYSYQRNTTKTAEDIRQGILSLLDSYRQPEYQAIARGVGDVRARLL